MWHGVNVEILQPSKMRIKDAHLVSLDFVSFDQQSARYILAHGLQVVFFLIPLWGRVLPHPFASGVNCILCSEFLLWWPFPLTLRVYTIVENHWEKNRFLYIFTSGVCLPPLVQSDSQDLGGKTCQQTSHSERRNKDNLSILYNLKGKVCCSYFDELKVCDVSEFRILQILS